MGEKERLAKRIYYKPFNELCTSRKNVVFDIIRLGGLKNVQGNFAKIPKAAFNFCRYGLALMVWASFILKIKWMLALVFIITAIAAIFTIRKSPLILLYSNTIGKLFKSEDEFLNIGAMRFAHSLCAILSGICLVFLYFGNEHFGWVLAGILAIFKTISAVTSCPAARIYSCVIENKMTCCSFFSRKKAGA